MTIPSPNLMENPLKLAHKSKNYQKAKGMSFFAFLFSVVIYCSIFYIFSLSPSTLLRNPKFWFVISNTLILIIAADSGAFSSSKETPDLFEEYALQSQARRSFSFVSQYPEIVKKSINPMEEESLKEKNKEDVAADEKNNEIPERILEVVKIDEPETDNFQAGKSKQEHPMKSDNNEAGDHQAIIKKKIDPKTIRRSKSDKVKRVTFHDKKNNLQRSKTEKHEPIISKENESPEEATEEQNEFSTMSDEELNRRVEEFIQKFNRQIRLQGARNRQLLEYQ
ncbi:hypothetical protein REPUB_Repub13aG0213400 [Reevesia pubescens]